MSAEKLLNLGQRCGLAAALLSVGIAANATDSVIVGGGYDLQASQGQIELNVKWVHSILDERHDNVRVFYTDGDDPGLDVYAVHPLDTNVDNVDTLKQQALPRVFGSTWGYKSAFTNHTVPNVSGSTQADQLVPSLQSLFSDTTDDLLFVYNGHGAQSFGNKSDVSLMLWNNTRLSANTLHSLLAEIDSSSSFKYVFTQCYSGGFHRLIYDDPNKGLALSEQNRCGFTAESAYRLAEGCSASINTDDYRDYTTFFFAALNGSDRNEQTLTSNPDKDGDGTTSLREAHLYALETAISTDLPRSSSEDYLTEWRPWFVRWNPMPSSLLSNEYTDLYRALLDKNEIEDNADTVTVVRERLSGLEDQLRTQVQEQYNLFDQIDELRDSLQRPLAAQHPELLSPYSEEYATFVSAKRDDVTDWIVEQPQYKELIGLQQQARAYSLKLLDTERQATQMQKILRARKLSTLKSHLYRYGSDQQRSDYQRLVSCEEGSL